MSSAHLPLMVWLSPAFPVGAFAYSHGIEWAFETGDLHDAATLRDWLDALVGHGSLRNDLILFAASFRATASQDDATLAEIAELALALANSAERRLETITQGNAFLAAARAAWPCEAFTQLATTWPGDVAYPVAVAVAASGHGLPLLSSLEAYGLAFVANLVSASVRLGIVGQTDGQRITAALVPALHAAAVAAETAVLDDLGGCAFRSDLAALRHETQYSRLFPLMTAMVAIVLAAILATIAALHAYWGLGGFWPAADARALALMVVGDPRLKRMPGPLACCLVAAALAVTALWPLVLAGLVRVPWPMPVIFAIGIAIASVFALRGVAGFVPAWRRRHAAQPFAGLDRRWYSPLCLVIAAGYALVLQGV